MVRFFYQRVVIRHHVGDQIRQQVADELTPQHHLVECLLRGVETPLGVATHQLQEVVDRSVAELESMRKKDKMYE